MDVDSDKGVSIVMVWYYLFSTFFLKDSYNAIANILQVTHNQIAFKITVPNNG